MGFLEALLALIGLALLILLAIGALSERSPEPPTEDRAAPYREGLHAALRIQGVAQDLEQQLYAEAATHMDDETDRSSAQATERR
jgi:hypothetical protein